MTNFVTSAVRRLADWVEIIDAGMDPKTPAGYAKLLVQTQDDMAKKFERLNVNAFDIWGDAQEEVSRRKAQRLISIKFKIARAQKAKELAELDAALTA